MRTLSSVVNFSRLIPLASLALAAGTANASDIVLNEWNCVGSQKWLGNPSAGNASCPTPDGPNGAGCATNDDTFYGRVMGNGGDWIELVVVKDHSDIRGWKIQWIETGANDADGSDIWYGDGNVPQGQIIFSNAAVWADLRAGTVITITEHSTALGGRDSDLTFDPCHGDWWINANCFDTSLVACVGNTVDPTNPGYDDPLDVGNDNWAARILNAQGNVHFGMTGEGQASWAASGVNSREIVRLEANPTTATSPFSNFRGGDNSTCGSPNYWKDAVTTCRVYQSLESLRAPVRNQLCTQCNPIALNEYNAVGSTQWLGGGNQAADANGGQASDQFFGRVMSNGGNWFELVVVADHLDMRGWKLEWADNTDSGVINLSNATFWRDLRSGTIVTFIERPTAQGGLDTDLSYSPGTGDIWVNINTYDTALVASTTSTKPNHVSGMFSTSNDRWRLRIRDIAGGTAMEPRGEGSEAYGRGGISFTNIFRLQADVNGRTDASSLYDDGASLSTFGAVNKWSVCPSGTVMTQSLAALPVAGCSYVVFKPADFNHDGIVDGADLGVLLGNWGHPGVSDLNGDGTTDGADLGILLGSWG